MGIKIRKTVTEADTQATTHYMGSFQYNNNTLQYIHTAEGYVRHTFNPFSTNSNLGAYGDFDYVYNYTDHLGNVRLSYTLDPSDQVLKILEENHYYPFGMKHSYNGFRKDIRTVDAEIDLNGNLVNPTLDPSQDTRRVRMVSNTGYQYKFQGQEFQDELGLNWHSYKWRNYNSEIGRFMSIDPLTEEYIDYTPYQFSSNQPVHAKELEGLESSNDLNKRGLEAEVRLGFGPTIGAEITILGVKFGAKYDNGTQTVKYNTKTETTEEKTSGGSVQIGIFGIGTEKSINVKNVKSEGATTPKQTVNSYKKESTELKIGFVSVANEETTSGSVSVPEGQTTGTPRLVIPSRTKAILDSETTFTPSKNSNTTEQKLGKMTLFSAEINAGIRIGVSIENVSVNPTYENTQPLYMCFVSGTKILMADNSDKNIEDIKSGDLIKTFDEVNNKIEIQEVLSTNTSFSNTFIEIEFEDGTKNINTLTHPYYIKNKLWCSFDPLNASKKYNIEINNTKLLVNDYAYKVRDNMLFELKIISIKIIERPQKTYNLSNVKKNHNFFANGVLVHNKN